MVKLTKNGENRQKMVLLPSKMVLPPSKMVLPPSKMVQPQAMAWVQYWFRVLSLKFCGKSKKICGDISQVSPAFCMYGWTSTNTRVSYCKKVLQTKHYSQVFQKPALPALSSSLQHWPDNWADCCESQSTDDNITETLVMERHLL